MHRIIRSPEGYTIMGDRKLAVDTCSWVSEWRSRSLTTGNSSIGLVSVTSDTDEWSIDSAPLEKQSGTTVDPLVLTTSGKNEIL
jgi:hypothetical protein